MTVKIINSQSDLVRLLVDIHNSGSLHDCEKDAIKELIINRLARLQEEEFEAKVLSRGPWDEEPIAL
jgi:hypothetical protein